VISRSTHQGRRTPAVWNGIAGTAEAAMSNLNPLQLVKDQIQRQQRLHAAQMLLAKAYRGIPYTDAQHTPSVNADLTYRGIQHHVTH
jgi:hypothetical protein